LQANGTGLVAVLDDLKDNTKESVGCQLVAKMCEWLPEYDRKFI